jgi:hypothetical protein
VIPLLLRKISFNFNHKIRHAREIGSLPPKHVRRCGNVHPAFNAPRGE